MSDKELQVQQRQEVESNGEPIKPEKQYVPAVDIYETEEAVTVLAEMPGVGRDGVEVNLDDGVLAIKGRQEAAPMAGKLLLQEYDSGCYLRKFTVSDAIDQEEIEATMADGVLTLVLPKVRPAAPKKIEVKAG